MATIKFILGIFCFATLYSLYLPDRNLLGQAARTAADQDCRDRILQIARREIGVREQSGNNDGVRVEAYLACTNLPKGYAWCASFISWIFAQEGFQEPRTAWSPALLPAARLRKTAAPGQVFGIYFPAKKRIAHVGLIEQVKDDWCLTIEGNTNLAGSAEGDGVYRRRRMVKTLYRTADWLQSR